MQELAEIHNEETEKTTRQVINGANFSEDMNANLDEYLKDTAENSYAYSEEDSEFL